MRRHTTNKPSASTPYDSSAGEPGQHTGWQPQTIALHAGWHPDKPGDPLVPSWQPSTVFRHPPEGLDAGGMSYTRLDNPNRASLEQTLARLESEGSHRCEALVYASGMAAVQAVFQLLSPGDHVLLAEDLYHGVRQLVTGSFARWGLRCDFVDTTDPDAVSAAATPQTRMLWLESPSNPMLSITDIGLLAEMCRERGWICVVDNTWCTPVIQRPIDLGAHISLYSTTKYIGGHSDVLGGALVIRVDGFAGDTPAEELVSQLRTEQRLSGAVPSPFDCWLLLRSLKTLYARITLQCQTAAELAVVLQEHARVRRVYYPGLADHPGYEVAQCQMAWPGAMISFEVRGDAQQTLKVVSSSRLLVPGTSLGGVESTWEHRKSSEHAGSATPDTLIRLSVGLEHVRDLRDDLERSLGVLQV